MKGGDSSEAWCEVHPLQEDIKGSPVCEISLGGVNNENEKENEERRVPNNSQRSEVLYARW